MRHSLYRFYSERRWAESFLDGELLFRSLSYFRDYEDQNRGDKNEGTVVFRPGGGLVIHNQTQGKTVTLPHHAFESSARHDEIFVFCLSRSSSEALGREFAAVVYVEVRNVRAFCIKVKQALPPEATFFGRRVDYYKRAEGGNPRWALPDKIASSKQDNYARQDEFRLVFSLTDALAFQSVATRLVRDHTQQTSSYAEYPNYLARASSLRDICHIHKL